MPSKATLFLLSLAAVARSLSSVSASADSRNATSIPEQADCGNRRSLSGIIWSCLVTVFACTWIAVHPNIPPPDYPKWRAFGRRAWIMMWAVLTPELIVLWAMRQWYAAREMIKLDKTATWTITHRFFIQIGGFVLYAKDKPLCYLTYSRLILVPEEIPWPSTSKRDIEDRSKGDFLSKGVVLLQTTWFATQCIARAVQGLALTELELATLSFAVLSFVMYFFWWDKPLDVQSHVPVPIRPDLEDSYIRWEKRSEEIDEEIQRDRWDKRMRTQSRLKRASYRLLFVAEKVMIFFMALMAAHGSSGNQVAVPTFYAERVERAKIPTPFTSMAIVAASVATIFGGIHCIAWSFHFASLRERTLWRMSSLTITCMPFLITLILILTYHGERYHLPTKRRRNLAQRFAALVLSSSAFLAVLLLIGYIIARCVLLALVFTNLRKLSDSAYEDVSWTNFIPHI